MAGTIEKRGVSGFTLGFDRLQTQHSSPNVLLSLVVCHLQVQESLWSSTVFFCKDVECNCLSCWPAFCTLLLVSMPLADIELLSDDDETQTDLGENKSKQHDDGCPNVGDSTRVKRKGPGKIHDRGSDFAQIRTALCRLCATNCPCSRRRRSQACYANFHDESTMCRLVNLRLKFRDMDKHDVDEEARSLMMIKLGGSSQFFLIVLSNNTCVRAPAIILVLPNTPADQEHPEKEA